MEITRDIENFLVVTNGILDSIKSLTSTQYTDNYKRVLCFGLLDMLSKSVYGDHFSRDSRKRFVSFVNDYCNWQYANHISLQQLIFVLEKDQSPRLDAVREFAIDAISKWPRSKPIPLDYDPTYEEIKRLWPGTYQAVNNKISLDYITHVHLLYTLRNSMVHDLRPLGYYFDLFSKTEPYYISRGAARRDENGNAILLEHESYELMHPVEFYYQLIENSLTSIKEFLFSNSLNPYDNFRSSSVWLDI